MFGQILIGIAQPFVLSAPTRYSDLWFTNRGRVAATALASLANPFGGALAQLIDPFLATNAKDIPNMVLYIAIIVYPPSLLRSRIHINYYSPPLHLSLHSSSRHIHRLHAHLQAIHQRNLSCHHLEHSSRCLSST
jgi:hypothetical protein